MLKFARFAPQRTYEICVLNHGEQQTFRDGTQHSVVYGEELDPAENVNVLSSTLVRLYCARPTCSVSNCEPT